MILSLHLISSGVKPGDIASRPATAILTALSPLQDAIERIGSWQHAASCATMSSCSTFARRTNDSKPSSPG